MMKMVSRDQRDGKRRESRRPSSTSSNTARVPRPHKRNCRTGLSRCATGIAAASHAIAGSGLPGDVQPLEPPTPRLDIFISLIIALVGDAEALNVREGYIAVHGLALRSGLTCVERGGRGRREGGNTTRWGVFL